MEDNVFNDVKIRKAVNHQKSIGTIEEAYVQQLNVMEEKAVSNDAIATEMM